MPAVNENLDPDSEVERAAALTQALEVLASPARMYLLREVRVPKTLKEIKVRVPEKEAGGRDRILARQSVKEHLDRLVEIGVVLARETQREYGETIEYILNHQRLFAISESFRALAKLRPAEAPDGRTISAVARANTYEIRGPCLVLVKGLDEGRTFDMRPRPDGRNEWVIGRRNDLGVSLDFDPFVSSENSRVLWAEGAYFIEDLSVSRNGTMLNFQPLPKGGRRALRTGDLIGVGRSLLMFRG